MSFTSGSVLLANSNWSGEVKLWNASTQKLRATFRAHDQNIPSIAFSPDGQCLATASADGSVKVWDVFGSPKIWDVSRSPAAPIVEQIGLGHRSAQEFNRLADVLKNNPLLPGWLSDAGTRLYLRDLVEGRTTLIADPTVLGLRWVECPSWSHDGRRIVFHAQPRNSDWTESRVVMIESHDGRPDFRVLGAGCCPSFSPDDQTIAFQLLSGEVPGEQAGVSLMNADGTNRRRVCESGSPFWSPDGSRLLINDWLEPTESRIYSFATKRTARVEVPGRKFYSWPRWAGPGQLVAGIGGETAPDSIVLVDVSQPSEAKVVRTVWSRSSGPNVNPRWPVVSPSSGNCFFIGQVGDTKTLYSLSQDAAGRGRLSALEVGGPKLAGLSLSGDGRYLLFDSDRLDREPSGRAAASIGDNPK